MAEPASNPSSPSPSSTGASSSESGSESESSSEHPSMARLGPDSCLSSVTKKEKSRAPFLPSARTAPAASAVEAPDSAEDAGAGQAGSAGAILDAGAIITPGAAIPFDRVACSADTAGLAMSPIVPRPTPRPGAAPVVALTPARAPQLIAPDSDRHSAGRHGGDRDDRCSSRRRDDGRRSDHVARLICAGRGGRSARARAPCRDGGGHGAHAVIATASVTALSCAAAWPSLG
mmetsp:Transcript_15863/g.44591  ORF Transcript_15863/g.44591 Transcript_15863/m.44591 type:complete len:232 (+) Transcript_15863:1115-1810(+)